MFERIVAMQLTFLAGRTTTTNFATFNLFCIHSFIFKAFEKGPIMLISETAENGISFINTKFV